MWADLSQVALNSAWSSYEGGGTWFEALGPSGLVVDAEVGCAVAFAGPLRHAGYPIVAGTRTILGTCCYPQPALVLFLSCCR
jgi:hypothetical protein